MWLEFRTRSNHNWYLARTWGQFAPSPLSSSDDLPVRVPQPLPPNLRSRPFAVAANGGAGISRQSARASDLASPFRGIRAPASDEGFLALCRAYAVRMSAAEYFSHATAAALHGLPLPRSVERDSTLHVSTPGRPPRVHGVVGHRNSHGSAHVVVVNGLRASSPVDTWRALAGILSLDDLIAAGDALVRRENPPSTLVELADAVAGNPNRRGSRALARAFALVRERADSPRETRTRLLIVRDGMPEPMVNPKIVNEYGAFLGYGDLVYFAYKILIEYDGETHFSQKQVYRDIERLDALAAAGWRIVRLNKTHSDLMVISKVKAALTAAGWVPGAAVRR